MLWLWQFRNWYTSLYILFNFYDLKYLDKIMVKHISTLVLSNFFKYLTGMMAVTDYRLCCGYGNSGTDTRGFDCLIIPGARSQNGQDLNAGALHFHPWLHSRILTPYPISLDPCYLKVTKFQKQILLFSFESKMEWSFKKISALIM